MRIFVDSGCGATTFPAADKYGRPTPKQSLIMVGPSGELAEADGGRKVAAKDDVPPLPPSAQAPVKPVPKRSANIRRSRWSEQLAPEVLTEGRSARREMTSV